MRTDGAGGVPAAIGGGWGAACALVMGGLRFVNSAPPQRWAELVGDTAFLAAYLVPFLVALLAIRWRSPGARAAVWAAVGVLAFLASFTAFSGISLIFLPASPPLALAAVRALSAIGLGKSLRALGLAVALIAMTTGAFLVLFVREDPRCWQLVRSAGGQERWLPAPYGASGTLSATGVGPVAAVCGSDIISPAEGALSLGLLSIGWVGLPASMRGRDGDPALETPP